MRGPSGQLMPNLPPVFSYTSGTCSAQGSRSDKQLKTSYYSHIRLAVSRGSMRSKSLSMFRLLKLKMMANNNYNNKDEQSSESP